MHSADPPRKISAARPRSNGNVSLDCGRRSEAWRHAWPSYRTGSRKSKLLADTNVYEDAAKGELASLLREQGEIRKTLPVVEEEWLGAAEQLRVDSGCAEDN